MQQAFYVRNSLPNARHNRRRHDVRGHNFTVVVNPHRVPLIPFKRALQRKGYLHGVTDSQVTMAIMEEFVAEHGSEVDVQAAYLHTMMNLADANGR